MEVKTVKISDLVFDPINARKHPTRNIEAIKGSLTKFGQQKPIVINSKNIVIAGNGTLAAAKELGWTSINCVVSDLDDLNQMAFALADNRTSELAEWDMDILQQQLAQLELNDFDVDMLSFDDLDLDIEDDDKEDISKTEDEKPEVTFSEKIGEKNNYVMLIFNNDVDWLSAETHFNIKKAKCERTGIVGIGRIIDGAKYLRSIIDV
jgi:ParB-like chromosome segregation protein Spo0J